MKNLKKRKWGDSMQFNEWLGDNSLFTEIQNIEPFSFIESYGATNLDMLYKMSYGTRTIPKSVEKLSVKDVANIIVISYGENWINKHELLTNEILLGVDFKTVENETLSDDTVRTSSSDTTNKVSAYNDDELVTNDNSSDSMNDEALKEINRNRDSTKTSMNAIKSQLELFNSNFIIDVVCKDVSKTVSLSIY